MNLKKIVPIVALILVGIIIVAFVIVFMVQTPTSTPGSKKAIILASSNDYYRKDGVIDFNEGNEAKFNDENNNWTTNSSVNMFGAVDSTTPGHDGLPGVLRFFAAGAGYGKLEFVFNWTKFYPLYESTAYYLSTWVNMTTVGGAPVIIGPPNGIRVGLRWLNSSNGVVRTDWSNGIFDTLAGWTLLNVTGVNNNSVGYEITQLYLVLSVEGTLNGNEMILFDEVRVEFWSPPPIPTPPPSNIDKDGFPAQALQVYWVLRNNGYSDDNVFLMLYHKNDPTIDIYAGDSITNDLTGAVVDVENDDVNASRFKQELDISIPGSFASDIQSNDELIIFITDHGSNKVISGGNATFHFEADNSYITESEFFNLVKKINCARMLINIDMCFSGNFLNEDTNIGSSWYNIPNSILVTSTTDLLSWYWRDNNNPDGYAGSWFFHQFWEQINQSQPIGDAFDFAKNFVPIGQIKSINDIQTPLIQDNIGVKDTWILV
ncbi:MAG: C13 family peptidase [Promethearchaeota archaeon]